MYYAGETYDQLIKPFWAPPRWALIAVLIITCAPYVYFGYQLFFDEIAQVISGVLYCISWAAVLVWLAVFRKRVPSLLGLVPIGAVLTSVIVLVFLTITDSLLKSEENPNFILVTIAPFGLWIIFALALHFRLQQLNKTDAYFAVPVPVL